jgi:hypothetical protein
MMESVLLPSVIFINSVGLERNKARGGIFLHGANHELFCYLDTTFPTRAIIGTGPMCRLSLELARLSPST